MSDFCQNKDQFIKNFKRAKQLFGLRDYSGTDDSAIVTVDEELFNELFNYTEIYLNAASDLNNEFADHGIGHVMSLSDIFIRFIENRDIKDSILYEHPFLEEFLVLLFSSFILHDIGMGIEKLEMTEEEYFRAVLKEKQLRHEHDIKSLSYIENLIKEYEKPDSIGLSNWMSFWKDRENWPKHKEGVEHAFYTIARICQSHGDAKDIFLNKNDLNFYKIVNDELQVTNKTIELPSVFSSSDQESFKQILYAASAFLSLCDLCDIRKERFKKLPENMRQFFLSENTYNKKQTFYHWAGNNLCKVTFFNDDIVFIIPQNKWRDNFIYSFLVYTGPGASLFEWCNHPNFKVLFQEIGFPIANIKIKLDTSFQDGWLGVIKEASATYGDAWNSSSEIITDSKLIVLYKIIHPNNLSWYLYDFKDDISHICQDYPFLLRLDSFINKGYCFCDLFNIAPSELSDKVYNLRIVSTDGNLILENKILPAMCQAKSIIKKLLAANIDKKYCIRIALNGSKTYELLIRNKLHELKDSIILFFLEKKVDNYYQEISNKLRNNTENIFIIFFGNEDLMQGINNPDLLVREIDDFDNKKKMKCEYIIKNQSIDDKIKINTTSLYSFINDIYFYSGDTSIIDIIEELYFIKMPYHIKQEEVKRAYSLLILTILFELVPLESNTYLNENDIRSVKKIYEKIVSFTPEDFVHKRFEDAFNQSIDLSIISQEKKHERFNKLIQFFSNKPGFHFWFLQLIMIHLRSRPYNINSTLIDSKTIEICDYSAFVKRIYKSRRPDLALNLAFGVAKQIATKGKLTRDVYSSFISAVLSKQNNNWKENIIIFQMHFQIAKGHIDKEEHEVLFSLSDLYNMVEFAYLGIYEALIEVVAEKPLYSLSRKFDERAFEMTQYIVDGFSETGTLIAFDIITKYSQKNKEILSNCIEWFESNLDRINIYKEICNYFHGDKNVDDVYIYKDSLNVYSDWVNFRNTFDDLIAKVPESVCYIKRRKPSEEMKNRVNNLQNKINKCRLSS